MHLNSNVTQLTVMKWGDEDISFGKIGPKIRTLKLKKDVPTKSIDGIPKTVETLYLHKELAAQIPHSTLQKLSSRMIVIVQYK